MGEVKVANTQELLRYQVDAEPHEPIFSVVHIFEHDLRFFVHDNLYHLAPHPKIWNEYLDVKEFEDAKYAWNSTNMTEAYTGQLKNHEESVKILQNLQRILEHTNIWLVDNESDVEYSPRGVLKDFLTEKSTMTGGSSGNASKS